MAIEEDILRQTLGGSRNFKNDHYFWLDLAEANLESEKKKIIQNAMLLAVKNDEANGTKTARNIIAVVTFQDADPKHSVRPGITILEMVGNDCHNENEVLASFKAFGAMDDSSVPLEKLIHIGKTKIVPFLENEAKGIGEVLNKFTENEKKRREEWGKRPWWKKLFLN